MNKRIILIATIFGAFAVIFGAFAAHMLKEKITVLELENWKTGVSYQFYHTLALLYLSTFSRFPSKLIIISAYCFTFGIVLFSGSLYLLSTRSVTGFNWWILGPITPLGGILFIVGWASLFLAAIKNK